MRYLYLVFVLIVVVNCYSATAQSPKDIQWQRSYGTSGNDDLAFAIRATDGGYLIGGPTNVVGPEGDMSYRDKGWRDYWTMKLDAQGNKLWDKGFGGFKEDIVMCAVAVSDGGYLIGGASLSGKEGDKSGGAKGPVSDYWLVKIDANGDKQWDRTIGSEQEDYCTSIVETADGSFLVGGTSLPTMTGDVTAIPVGAQDFWIVKLDKNGNKKWDKIYGGKNSDRLAQIINTSDGGFLAVGSSSSLASGSKTENAKGFDDYWIIKADSGGAKQWDRTIGSTKSDFATCVAEAYNGGYLVAGIAGDTISGDKTKAGKGFWVVRLDSNGNKKWEKMFNDEKGYAPSAIIRSGDGGYLLAGTTANAASAVDTIRGDNDYIIMRLDTAGNKSWVKTIGGRLNDTCISVIETEDGYVLCGSSASPDGADKSGHKFGSGNKDFWIVKLGKFPLTVSSIDNGHVAIAQVAGLSSNMQIVLKESGAAQYLIFDMSGRKVNEGILLNGRTNINVQPGVYNIYIRQQGQQQIARVMVY